jgi:uncharacterized protein YndB with AHSA1/START domain
MTSENTVTVRVIRHFTASAERVFDAWLDTERAKRWLFATPQGRIVRATLDARVGGSFCFVDRRGEDDIEHWGTYIELARPRRLVFDFWAQKAGTTERLPATRVSIDIEPLEQGCRLTLTHDGVFSDFVTRTESGWAMILEGLAKALQTPH